MILVVPTFLVGYTIVALWVSRCRIIEFFQGRLTDGTSTSQILLLEATAALSQVALILRNAWLQYMTQAPVLVLFLVGAILSGVNLWSPSVFTKSGSG